MAAKGSHFGASLDFYWLARFVTRGIIA
jgi:hypothetical protein